MKDTPTNAALTALIDNWTNPEFEKFVDDLADLVNAYVVLLLEKYRV